MSTRGTNDSNGGLKLMMDLLNAVGTETIKIPKSFHGRVSKIKEYKEQDSSGLACSLLDFAINCASVPLKIETSNKNLTKRLASWADTINFKLKKAQTGLRALASQYFNERWLGSSLLVLETQWENVGGWYLPTNMFFLDGGSLYYTGSNDTLSLDTLDYGLKISKKSDKDSILPLIDTNSKKYFFQSPYAMWGEPYPSPFLIRRGTYYNALFLQAMKGKGASVATRALEHMMMIKLGTEKLAMSNAVDYSYGEDEFKQIDAQIKSAISAKNGTAEMMKYISNFDHDISHLIPEYDKVIGKKFLEPGEKAILASLGFIEVFNTAERKEAILNPKVFISEVEDGISDFVSMIQDVILTAVQLNTASHKKLSGIDIRIDTMPVKQFIDSDIRTALRGMWDRGKISDRTYTELCGNVDYDIEVTRSKKEYSDGSREFMKPQPSRYTDLIANDNNDKEIKEEDLEDIPEDKKGIEKLQYDNI